MQFRIKILILLSGLFLIFPLSGVFAAGQWICGKDMNGDGDANPDEIKTCSVGGEQTLCPIDAVDCNIVYTPVLCPSETSWNSVTKNCEVSPIVTERYMAIKTSSDYETNDCIFPQESFLPEGTPIVSSVPEDAISLGNRIVVTDCDKHRYWQDRAYFDRYAYYYINDPTCLSGTSLSSDKLSCVAAPSCSEGTYDSVSGQCSSGMQCPLNTGTKQFVCVDTGGQHQCSPNQCVDPTGPSDTNANLTGFHDDGNIDATTGTCSGELMIFNGQPAECRVQGYKTNYNNCCRLDAHYSATEFTKYCTEQEKTLIANRDAGVCHAIGQYCKKNSIFGCLQKAETYCCFGSKMARIIHEQGRNQLKEYSNNNLWGGPTQPLCNGLSSEQLSMLDFNQMDISEFTGSLSIDSNLFNSVESTINEFYSNTAP